MSEHTLDCQGLACPQPVLKCRDCVEQHKPKMLSVLVDNEAAKENVSRFLASQAFLVESSQSGSTWTVTAKKSQAAASQEEPAYVPCPVAAEQKIVALITSDVLGEGDRELGQKLMFNFIATLPELGTELWRIIMLNAGVKLAAANSTVIGKLKELETAGVSILVCGTCLDYYGLLEQKDVGQTTNMLDVMTSLQLASKIIKV